jgi:adenosyl cobinamide kinase/adenosyl cobinamide phosphate guanylyltransferase
MALVVLTGGARSGKSGAAEQVANERLLAGQRVVVAVFASQSDAEMTDRIARHQSDRPAGFDVIEGDGSSAWLADVQDDALLVVDCLGTWLGRALESAWELCSAGQDALADAGELPHGMAALFSEQCAAIVRSILVRAGDTLVVTNEVGSGIVPAYATGRLFRDELGRANAHLIAEADAACLVVAGRIVDLSALPSTPSWPTD